MKVRPEKIMSKSELLKSMENYYYSGLKKIKEGELLKKVRGHLPSIETEYYTEIEYLEYKGIIAKLMGKIAPSFFEKKVLKWMKRFKTHLEK